MAIHRSGEMIAPPLHCVRETYLEKLYTHKLIPVFTSTCMSISDILHLYKMTQGIFLIGGGDINPFFYGEVVHPKTSNIDNSRDNMEIVLLSQAFRDKKPVLGICRGAQVIAVAAGGKLIQHLEEISGERHIAQSYEEALKNSNEALIVNGTLAHKILNTHAVAVSCAHHQAIETPGKDMLISARTRKGVAEIIECTIPKYFCVGIQSHPELLPKGPLEPFFASFAKAVRK